MSNLRLKTNDKCYRKNLGPLAYTIGSIFFNMILQFFNAYINHAHSNSQPHKQIMPIEQSETGIKSA